MVVSLLLNASAPANAQAPTMTEEAALAVVKDAELDSWIEKLVQAESGGREDIVILDVNNKYSHGCLQFQRGTFDSFSARYGIEGDIMSCDFQKKLAKLMLVENRGNWRHWQNSVKRKVGLPPM